MGNSTGIICGQTQPIFQTTPGPSGLNDASVPGSVEKTDSPEWNSAHLIYVIEMLQAASTLETSERTKLDHHLVQLLNQEIITQQDFEHYTADYYYWVRAMLPYFVQKGDFIRQYDWFQRSLSQTAPSGDATEQRFMAEVAFPFMSKNVCAAVENMDMSKAKKLLKEWFQLLYKILERRVAAVRLMTVAIERKIKTHRDEILKKLGEHESAKESYEVWHQVINEAKEVTKFVDELKSIKDLNDDIQFVGKFFSNPMKRMKMMTDRAWDDAKGKAQQGATKWDIIKSGIMMLGNYYANMELFAHNQTNIGQVLRSLSQSTNAILELSERIIEWEPELHKIRVLGEINLAIQGVEDWGRL